MISYLKPPAFKIAMLQETHPNDTELLKLKQRWLSQVFSASGNEASRGTSILVSPKNWHYSESVVSTVASCAFQSVPLTKVLAQNLELVARRCAVAAHCSSGTG